uniref:Dynactin subunit 4 n=1 Tax=Rhinopithecus bieti TaxID=61621 RepID=A0A2K6LYD4_RHIBE
MASLLQSDRVLYLVQGEKKVRAPLSQLYFCRYCSGLRSLECVSHEYLLCCTDISCQLIFVFH